jgi:hypothetical protein
MVGQSFPNNQFSAGRPRHACRQTQIANQKSVQVTLPARPSIRPIWQSKGIVAISATAEVARIVWFCIASREFLSNSLRIHPNMGILCHRGVRAKYGSGGPAGYPLGAFSTISSPDKLLDLGIVLVYMYDM